MKKTLATGVKELASCNQMKNAPVLITGVNAKIVKKTKMFDRNTYVDLEYTLLVSPRILKILIRRVRRKKRGR